MAKRKHGHWRIRNWERYQHYKLRNPPWIKLYRDVLGDRDLMDLTDSQKWCVVGLLILASLTDNKIPNDPSYVRRQLSMKRTPDLGFLADHTSFLEWVPEAPTKSKPRTPRQRTTSTSSARGEHRVSTRRAREEHRVSTRRAREERKVGLAALRRKHPSTDKTGSDASTVLAPCYYQAEAEAEAEKRESQRRVRGAVPDSKEEPTNRDSPSRCPVARRSSIDLSESARKKAELARLQLSETHSKLVKLTRAIGTRRSDGAPAVAVPSRHLDAVRQNLPAIVVLVEEKEP